MKTWGKTTAQVIILVMGGGVRCFKGMRSNRLHGGYGWDKLPTGNRSPGMHGYNKTHRAQSASVNTTFLRFFLQVKSAPEESTELHIWCKIKSWKLECILRNNNTDGRMDITTMTQQLTASDRLGHTWTFNISLLAVGLSGGQIVVDNPPTLSWHVKEGREGGKRTLIRKKKGWFIR